MPEFPQWPLEWQYSIPQDVTGEFPRRLAVAYYKASQAWFAIIAGAKVKELRVADGGGKLVIPRLPRDMNEKATLEMLIALAAGEAAQFRYLDWNCGYYHRDAQKIAKSCAGSDREIFRQVARGTRYTFDSLRNDAYSKIFWKHEWKIQRIAERLDRVGYLSGDQCESA